MTLEDIKQLIFRKQTDYKLTFANPGGKRVAADIMRFCFATRSMFNRANDPITLARLEGRREVAFYVQQQLKMSPDDLWELRKSEGKF